MPDLRRRSLPRYKVPSPVCRSLDRDASLAGENLTVDFPLISGGLNRLDAAMANLFSKADTTLQTKACDDEFPVSRLGVPEFSRKEMGRAREFLRRRLKKKTLLSGKANFAADRGTVLKKPPRQSKHRGTSRYVRLILGRGGKGAACELPIIRPSVEDVERTEERLGACRRKKKGRANSLLRKLVEGAQVVTAKIGEERRSCAVGAGVDTEICELRALLRGCNQ